MPTIAKQASPSARARPGIVCWRADRRFAEMARSMGLDPLDRWVGGYADHEWDHGRWFLDGAFMGMSGRRVLEFGCNLGATAVVLAALGAEVEGVDVDEKAVRLGRLNVARYGCDGRVRLHHVADTTALPWPDGHFDAVVCNSVLEYVRRPIRPRLLRELDRLLRPGGALFVIGTSNRLWPREVHTRRLLVNYLPDRLAAALGGGGKPIQRGVWPFEILRPLRGYTNLCRADRGRGYCAAKAGAGAGRAKLLLLKAADRAVRPLGMTVGLLTPSISVVLQKPPAPGHAGRESARKRQGRSGGSGSFAAGEADGR